MDLATTMHLVPGDEVPKGVRPVTRSELVRDLRTLGVRPGAVVMVHTRMSAIGWVVGGADVVVMALLDALGTEGTLMAYVGWDENPWQLDSWPEEWQRAYLEELPPFDPALMEADREVGRIPERIRTWPGARRSVHPEAGMVTIGARSEWIADPQPWDFPYGSGSPLARLVESGGQVLMLGAPLDTITLLHHAEHLTEAPGKRFVERQMPVFEGERSVWRTYRDIDTSARGAFPYEEVLGHGVDPFTAIAKCSVDRWRRARRRCGTLLVMELAFPSADPRLIRLELAAEVLNRFYWNVSVEHAEGEVRLRGGELLIARFASVEELEVFTAGMALALSVLPEEVAALVDQLVGE